MTITTEAEVVEAIRSAQAPLSLRGGNTRGMAGPGADLSLAGLLTLVAQAGTPVSEIETTLAAEGQRLAFEPMDHRALMGRSGTPTIGGAFAANVSGPRRLAVGAARDFLLGVRFIDGQGYVIKNGGRVMKNVTGYDLVKLMAGSRGTLGAVTEVSLKVLPEPETSATLMLSGLDDLAAIAAMALAMRSPFEVTAAAHDPAQGQTSLRLEGFESSVTYRLGRLKDLLSPTGAELEDIAAEPSATLWRDLRDVAAYHGAPGDVWRVHCRPTEAPALAAKAGAEAHLYDWAGGLIWLRMAPGTDLRARLGLYDGHATLLRAEDAAQTLPRQEPEAPGVARLTAGLRAKFDPRGLFNAPALAHSA